METGDEEIQDYVLRCISEISTQEYESLQFYFGKVCALTQAATTNPCPKVGAQAYEFWTTLAREEAERADKQMVSMGYISQCQSDLVALALQGLLILYSEEDDEEEEWGPAMSAGCCL